MIKKLPRNDMNLGNVSPTPIARPRTWLGAWGCVVLVIPFVLSSVGNPAVADQYERLETARLESLARGESATKHASLTLREIEALPNAFSDSRSTLLVIKTDQGNVAKLLVTPALRKLAGRENDLEPVLLIEQLQTFETGKSGSRIAKTSGLILFDGFRLDLDLGQAVPADHGEDLSFEALKAMDGVLKTTGKAGLWTVDQPRAAEKSGEGPSKGRAVLATDFAGRYQLEADGRFKGLFELTVADDRQVTGQFRSEPNGTYYPVKGQVSSEVPHKITFTIHYPRVEQEFEGYLATEGKSSIAGTFEMEGRTFGFHAKREVLKGP